MSDGTLIFEIYQGGELVRTESLDQDIIKIGKLPSSHLRLEDPQVSRIHAVIERSKDGSVYIIDLGSSRGTLVNGQKVNKWQLSSGDEITLGGTRILFKVEQAAANDAYDPDATAVGLSVMDFADEATQVGRSPQPEPAPAPAPSTSGGLSALTRPGASGGMSAMSRPSTSAAMASISGSMQSMSRPEPAAADPGQQVYAAAASVPYASSGASSAVSSEPAPAAEQPSIQTQGNYDEYGNWHDGSGGWYDPEGNYHDGTGGWYDPEGNYHDGQGGWYDPEGNYHLESGAAHENRVSDGEVFSESFLHTGDDSSGNGALEVAFMWMDHVLAVNQYRQPRDVTIGEAGKTTFQMKHESIPDPQFALIKADGGVTLNFTQAMDGLFYIGQEEFTMEQLIASGRASQGGYGPGSYSLPVTAQTRARLTVGYNTILVHYAEAPKALPIGGLGMDIGFASNLALSTVLHAVFMFLVFFIPPGAQDFRLDNFDLNNRFVSQLVKPEEPIPEEEPDWMKNQDKDEEGAKAKEAEGKAGKKDSNQKNKKMAVKGPKDNTEVQIAKAREKAYNTGALDVMKGAQITASWGQGQETLGMQAITAMGDNNGSKIGEAFGLGAFGATGTGRGGGGVSERSFGAGRIGTAGRGGGGGGGGGDYGRNAGQLDERATVVPKVIPGRPVVSGSLDREIIRRVIRRHRREIKYCYERELIKNKSLAGKVIVSFTISGTGAVVAASAKGGTLGNAAVSSCVASKVRRWSFPEPNGGGIVRVTYPFVFAPQN